MNKLRSAREFCFQYLFHLQLPVFESLKTGYIENQDKTQIRASLSEFRESTNTLFDDDSTSFIETNVFGTIQNYEAIQETIEKNLKNWKLSRLSKVDHTTLVLAVFELCFSKKAPVKVVINEAIEISKKFGSLESASFINGVLDNIAKNEK